METTFFVFQHKKESNRIKMIQAPNIVKAMDKLERRLLKGFTAFHDTIDDYQYAFMI